MGNNGGSIGPYNSGKIYCGKCGEFRRYGVNAVTASNGKLTCIECGWQCRANGRHWTKSQININKVYRY